MAATQRLELRQGQTLVMTPQLQQAIKLLQCSNLEVAAFVERELEQNPLLERDERPELGQLESDPDPREEKLGAESQEAADSGEGDGSQDAATPDSWELSSRDDWTPENEGALDADYGNEYHSDGAFAAASGGMSSEPWQRGSTGGGDSTDRGFEELLGGEMQLRDHLVDQLNLTLSDPVDRLIGLHLIDLLDESGLITEDLSELAESLGCGEERVESVLLLMQSFDPTGLFARDLRECLALQLAERDRLDPAMAAMLDNLSLVSQGKLQALTRVCGVDMDDIQDMLAELRSLDPRPAQSFDHAPVQAVVPDVFLRVLPSGKFFVELNSDSLPRVLVNEHYYKEVSQKSRHKSDLDYLTDRFQNANWLVKALHQRATTILKVSGEVVRQQEEFFRKGVAYLKPMTLRDIAEQVELHESTVSRVTSNKYIATGRGTFELKYFFSAALAASDGGSHSAESIRHKIRQLIENETRKTVLSDDTIVDILRQEGVEIARRTVAKYRESMRIPSSVQRRRVLALKG